MNTEVTYVAVEQDLEKTVVSMKDFDRLIESGRKVDKEGRCKDTTKSLGACFYRRPKNKPEIKGSACFIGHLIPDELIGERHEEGKIPGDAGGYITTLMATYPEIIEPLFKDIPILKLREGQRFHDNKEGSMEEWVRDNFTWESEMDSQEGRFCDGVKEGSFVRCVDPGDNDFYKEGQVYKVSKSPHSSFLLVRDFYNGYGATWELVEPVVKAGRDEGQYAHSLDLIAGDNIILAYNGITKKVTDDEYRKLIYIVDKTVKYANLEGGLGGRALHPFGHKWIVVSRKPIQGEIFSKPKPQKKSLDNHSNNRPSYNVTGWGNGESSLAVPLNEHESVYDYVECFGLYRASKEWGVSITSVWRIHKSLKKPTVNVIKPFNDYDKDFRMRACQYACSTGSASQAASVMGCSSGSIYNWLRTYNMANVYFNKKKL